jgi:hypothetical protein
MADIISDGNVKVSWVTTISNTAAPTTSELNAGVALESFITPDGLKIDTSTDAIDNSALNSTQSTQMAGRRSDSIELTMKNQGQSAAPWTTFASKPSGYVVIRRSIATTTAYASGQKLQVFPAQAGDRNFQSPAANDLEKFSVKFFITGAVVDASSIA